MLKDFHYFVISETKMNSNDLIKDLKNRKFSPVYLLHGEESFYIDQISDYIEENVLSAAEKSFNQTIFYGKDSDPMSILNAAKRYPMMSDYQVILVKDGVKMVKMIRNPETLYWAILRIHFQVQF
jgi:DNA polymerase-3 subunit delta